MTRWSVHRPMVFGFLVVAALVGGFGGWATLSYLAGAIVAPGQIEVEQNRQVIQHPDGGVVSEILVSENDTVAAGDILMRLDPTLLQSQLSITENQLYETLARKARLSAERDDAETLEFDPLLIEAMTDPAVQEMADGQSELFHARIDTLERTVEQLGRRREQIEDQIDGITAQRSALEEQLALIEEELGNQQSLLQRGLAQAGTVLSLQREKARLSGQVGELIASKAQAEGRITELEIEILRLRTQRREDAITELRDLTASQAELMERRTQILEQLDRLNIRAPMGGVVYDMQVFAPRSVLRPADPVMYIIPQDRPLIIASRVAPIHVDQIYVGQQVTLRFPAFDSRRTPEVTGRVVQISADAFVDERTQKSYYRSEIALDADQLANLPDGMVLIPGMPVEAYLRTADRTPLAYLTKPLTDYFTRAFRED